jgi:uncharacterized repeat protein (TIGR03803 family)
MGMLAAAGTALLAGCAVPTTTALPERAAAFGGVVAAAAKEQVLYNFSGGNDGGDAATALLSDSRGNLYGTTVVGGAYACGTIFKLKPQASPPWPETVLYSFTCYGDGKNPYGGVNFDPHGNLDGATVSGGAGSCSGDGCGLVFSLTPTTERVLHSFTGGSDGFGPGGRVVFDSAGNMYGTTPDGGTYSEGTIYELARSRSRWRESVIHAFTGGKDGGVGSLGDLLLDASGNIYGVTEVGGAHGAGTAFKLSRIAKKRWRLTTLYAFKGTPDAASPYGGLIADASGNLYGTTYYGGASGLGSVFKLALGGKGRYRERVLYSFKGGSDGSSSTSTLAFGKPGVLYGTASAGGGTCGCGTIFEVDARSGNEQTLHRFGNGTDGAYPYYGLTADGNGNFVGTTVAGGSFGQGTVFEFKP